MLDESSFVAAQIGDVIFGLFSFGVSSRENGTRWEVSVLRKYLIVGQTNIFIEQPGDVLIENLVTDGSSCFLYKRIIPQSDKLVQFLETLFGHAVV